MTVQAHTFRVSDGKDGAPPCFIATDTLAHRWKQLWFQDILAAPLARRFLWSLYYAGEAYAELHPQGVYADLLPSPLDRLLARHLSDETRHAQVFRALLASDGLQPTTVAAEEDVGWTLLNQVVPDVVAAGARRQPFDQRLTMRYMGFLHALELRSMSDLAALREAAIVRGERQLAADLLVILGDERFHASYTHRAFWSLARSRRHALAELDAIRTAERRGYHDVAAGLVDRFRRLGAVPAAKRARLRWRVMRVAIGAGVAFGPIPRWRRLPQQLFAVAR